MKSTSLKLPLAALLLLLPTFGLAASIFTPVPGDMSIQYLTMIFGQVENVLPVGGNPISKIAMTTFNYAVLTLGGIIIMYSLMVSTLNTANDGEVLGKDWNSVWIPLRTAFGFSLLLPVQANSYTAIQIFMMWIVTQGVYAADHIWNAGLDGILQGKITPPSLQLGNMGTKGVPNQSQAQSIFVSLVCAKLLPPAEPVDPNGNMTPSPWTAVSSETKTNIFFGPSNPSSPYPCGNIAFDTSDATSAAQTNTFIKDLVQQLDIAASQFVVNYAQDASQYSDTNSSASQAMAMSILQAATTFDNQTLGTQAGGSNNDGFNNKSNGNQIIDAAKKAGWIYAGSFFLSLSKVMNDQVSGALYPLSPSGYNIGAAQNAAADSTTFVNEMSAAQNVGGASPASSLQSMSGMTDLVQNSGLGLIQGAMMSLFDELTSLGGASGTNAFPITTIQNTGIWIVRLNGIIFVTVTAAQTVAIMATCGAASTNIPGVKQVMGGLCAGLKFVVGIFILPFFVLMGILYAIGITMAFYIPLIPFMIFTIGGIGWFILVIEAMVAAPLMALGIIHPEGKHTVFGEAYQGIMIIASVFLRPCLMIVGLLISFVFVYVVVVFITIGYQPMVNLLAAKEMSIIGLLVMMAMYISLITIGLNKAFSIIYVLPNQIMRWIGGSPESHGPEQEMQEIKGGVKEGHEGGSKFGQETGGKWKTAINEARATKQGQSGGPTTQKIT